LATALREITETKNLLQSLIVSSESFDYPKAKLVLKALHQKARDLGRLQAKMEKEQNTEGPRPANVYVLDFKQPAPPSKNAPRQP
jgi:hypothetical protein